MPSILRIPGRVDLRRHSVSRQPRRSGEATIPKSAVSASTADFLATTSRDSPCLALRGSAAGSSASFAIPASCQNSTRPSGCRCSSKNHATSIRAGHGPGSDISDGAGPASSRRCSSIATTRPTRSIRVGRPASRRLCVTQWFRRTAWHQAAKLARFASNLSRTPKICPTASASSSWCTDGLALSRLATRPATIGSRLRLLRHVAAVGVTALSRPRRGRGHSGRWRVRVAHVQTRGPVRAPPSRHGEPTPAGRQRQGLRRECPGIPNTATSP